MNKHIYMNTCIYIYMYIQKIEPSSFLRSCNGDRLSRHGSGAFLKNGYVTRIRHKLLDAAVLI